MKHDAGIFLEKQKVRSHRDWMRKLKIFERVLVSVAIVLAGVAGLYGLYRIVFMSRIFSVEHIEVDGGLHYTTSEEIAALSGVGRGDGLFTLDTVRILERLHMEPWIKYAAVRRKLPHTVCVHIEEYEPKALALVNGSLFYVDEEARIFKKMEIYDEKDFPVLTGLETDDDGELTEIGALRAEEMFFIAGVFTKISFLNARGIAEINYSDVNGYSIVTLEKPMRIILGHTALEDRLNTINRLFAKISDRPGRIQYMLANEEGRIIVKYTS